MRSRIYGEFRQTSQLPSRLVMNYNCKKTSSIQRYIMPEIRSKQMLKRELSTWDFDSYIQASPIQMNVLYPAANQRFPGLHKPDQQVKPGTQRNCTASRESSAQCLVKINKINTLSHSIAFQQLNAMRNSQKNQYKTVENTQSVSSCDQLSICKI